MNTQTTLQSDAAPAGETQPTAPPPLASDLSEAAGQAADAIWASGLQELCKKESDSPEEEDIELSLGDRNGSNKQLAADACSIPWGELADNEVDDSANWSYAQDRRRDRFDSLWDDATGHRGCAQQAWKAILAELSEREEYFDEDDFERDAKAAAWETAQEFGYDTFYEMTPRITGGICGMLELQTPCIESSIHRVGASIPDFKSEPDAWAATLSTLRIHPGEFANACGDLARAALADAESVVAAAGEPEMKKEFKDELQDALRKQGLLRRCGKNPEAWTGGLAELASVMSASGASLPPMGQTLGNAQSLAERIFSHGEERSGIEVSFGADGDALMAQSELVERFNLAAPICCERLFAKHLTIESPELYLDGEPVSFKGFAVTLAEEICWQNYNSSDDHVQPVHAAARKLACQADSLRWYLAPSEQEASPSLSAAAVKLIDDLSRGAPEAFSWGTMKNAPRGQDQDLLAQCMDLYEMGQAAAAATRAKHPSIKSPEPVGQLSLEHFDPMGGPEPKAPWRSAVSPKLAASKDSVGNTLAHKACAGRDPELLALALGANPELADRRNLAGVSPLDLLLATRTAFAKDEFFGLAKAFLSACPHLAAHVSANGKSILSEAVRMCQSKSLPIHDSAIELLDLGCSLSAPKGKPAPWRGWAGLGPDDFIPVVKAAIARGWNINEPGHDGATLGDIVWRVESAMALAELGASFPRGIAVNDPEQRAQVESVVLRVATPAEPIERTRPLRL